MTWEVVVGLEVHAELSTRSKIFCGCTTAFGGEPNSQVCPVCSGMPGSLPRLNSAVVEYAARLGIALNCEIANECVFDRKNYFYPDLPKAYQISQLYAPICSGGFLEIEVGEASKKIGIREIHMEEDAGKLIHNSQSGETFMDFNRCGVPLLEIVSLPDIRSGAEAAAYLERLREILLYLDICDCKMQEGSLRADVNLSVRRCGSSEFGVRTEMKNLNSIKAVSRAIEHESVRQIALLDRGGTVTQQTRRWDDTKGESYAMRSKENAQDYRYFPEPDLPNSALGESWLARILENMPELAHEKRERYAGEFGISAYEAKVLTGDRNIAGLFEELASLCGNPKEAARLISGELMRLMNASSILPEELNIDASKLAKLVVLVTEGKISRDAYKETIEAVFTQNVDPGAYIAQKGLLMQSDDDAVMESVLAAINDNPEAVADYFLGKEKALTFLMGKVMKKLGKSANPIAVKKSMEDRLQCIGGKK